MNIETNGIPNIRLENIGTSKRPLYLATGSIELNSWTGYYLFDDSYKIKKDKVVKNGRIDLWIDHAIAEYGGLYIPQEQVNTYHYLVEHQENIKRAILAAFKKEFPRLLSEEYASWDQEYPGFPSVTDFATDSNLKDYLGPESIHIGEDVKDGMAYVTWRFRCRWDIEHGFGVISHKDRVIDLGPDPDIFKIYKDNDTYEEVEKELQGEVWKKPRQKKWWQFW